MRPLMAVVIQNQVDSKASGVMFTINANNGALTEYTVEAVFGQGEGYVSGNLKPDKYMIRQSDGKVLLREIVDKEYFYDVVDSKIGVRDIKKLPEHLRTAASLTIDQLRSLARYGKKLFELYNCIPQDIEFAIDSKGKVCCCSHDQSRRCSKLSCCRHGI